METTIHDQMLSAHALKARSAPLSPSIVSGLIGIADALCVFLTGLVIFMAYDGWYDNWGSDRAQLYLTALTIGSLMIVTAFYLAGLHDFSRVTNFHKQLTRILCTCAIVFLILTAFAFALKISAEFSRVWGFSWFMSAALMICLTRGLGSVMLRKWARSGRLGRHIVIVGASAQARRLVEQFRRVNEPWNRVIALFDDRLERREFDDVDYPVRGNVDDLLEFARTHRVDDIAIAIPWSADTRILQIVDRLCELPVHLHLGMDLVGFSYPSSTFSSLGGISTLDVVTTPLEGWRWVTKHLEDKILAFILLILTAPLMAIIAVAVKLDSKGPALFRQDRYGFNNQIFSVYKFRTMYISDAPGEPVRQASRDDPRITRVGKWLRRISLDELPQLLNVLQGSMSLVGPRPHAVPHNEEYAVVIRGYFARHRVKPGITGWAQVNGLRGETQDPEKMRARVQYDTDYIERWSLLFDFRILAVTAVVVWHQGNAY